MLTITHPIRTFSYALAVALATIGSGPTTVEAQDSGRILGRVVDSATQDEIVGAQVVLDGHDSGAVTGEEGRFSLANVPAGSRTVRVIMLGYAEGEATVTVRGGQSAMLAIELEERAVEVEGLTIEATIESGSAVALRRERHDASSVVDAIGSEQISRSADGDAAAVVSRSPGVTVVGGRYVYVRGLGERYGSATLNGAPLASTEPDRKVVPLDLIPSGFLESVVTAKTYSPDQPGDYAGGLVQLRTLSYPPFGLFRINASTSWDTQASFADGLSYAGGGLDALGLDDGTRSLPSGIESDRAVTTANYSPGELEQIGESFSPVWAPTSGRLPLNQSLGIVVGDEWLIGDYARPLGFLASANYSNGYRNRPNEIERVFTSMLLEEPRIDYAGNTTTHTVGVGGMLQLAYEPARTHKLTASAVFSRSTEDQSRLLEGIDEDIDANIRNFRLQYLATSMLSAQLRGEHYLPSLGETKVEWRGDLRGATRYEPNTRELLYAQGPDGVYRFENFITSGSVFHQDLNEFGWGGALDVTVPFMLRGADASVAIGGSADLRARDTYTRRLRFINTSLDQATRELTPDQILSSATIAPDSFQVQEATFPGDNYDAAQDILAGYAMLDFSPLSRLRIAGGVRMEAVTQEVDPIDLFGDGQGALPSAGIDNRDFLPALNLTVALTSAMNLRFGASRTLARPQFRELAPFGYADYAGGYYTRGNPLLERTSIRNYDARWEWFPGQTGVIALSGFYKEFDAPIEVLVFQSGGELGKTWFNAAGAENYGIEVELRSSLGFISPALETLTLNSNLTLVESRVRTDEPVLVSLGTGDTTAFTLATDERPLQGLSPYVVNLSATWVDPNRGTAVSALFNRFGARVQSVGLQPLPSIYESARNSLDIVLQQPLGGQWSIKLAAERVLGGEIEYTQGGDVLRFYDTGRLFTLSASWGGGE